MTGLKKWLQILVLVWGFSTVVSIQCYHCDNSVSPACGRHFQAYQFKAHACDDHSGVKTMCGKQEQPPDRNGWVGVIRSCYSPGDLPGINETAGCHHFFHKQLHFSALYCFCDSSYCNQARPTCFLSVTLLCLVMLTVIDIAF